MVDIDWDVGHLVKVTQLQRVFVAGDEVGKNDVPPFLIHPKIVSEGAGDIQESVEVVPGSSVQETGKDRGLAESLEKHPW